MTNDNEFTGVWIPEPVLHDKSLTLAEKLLIGYITSFKSRKCFASNRHIAEQLGLSMKTVANCLVSLRKKRWVTGRLNVQIPGVGGSLERDGGSLKREGGIPQNGNIEHSREQSIEKYCSATPNQTASRFPSLQEAQAFGESVALNPDELISEKVREWHAKHCSAPPDLWRPHLEAFIDRIERDRVGL